MRSNRRALMIFVVAAGFVFAGSVWSSEFPLPGPPLELAWSVEGDWGGVAVPDGSPILYASGSNQLFTVNLKDGAVAALGPSSVRTLRVGVHFGQPLIVGFNTWQRTVAAYTFKGQRLWTYETEDGIDDVWPVDLDADGNSEVVVGLNASGGVLALSSAGRVLWSNRGIHCAWHVTAAPMDDRVLRVLTTSAGGLVHVLSVTGEPVATLDRRFYSTHVRLGDQAFVGGSSNFGDEGTAVATLDPSGWTVTVSPSKAGIGSLAAAPSIPWIGVGTVEGDVYALSAANGAVKGVASDLGRFPELAWAQDGDSTLLIAASSEGLRAFRVTGSK